MALATVTTDFIPNLNQLTGSNQDKVEVVFSFAGDASHLAAGDALALQQIGLSTLDHIVFEDLYLTDTTFHHLTYDRSTNTFITYLCDVSGASGDEWTAVADGDLSANTYRGRAVGKPLEVNA